MTINYNLAVSTSRPWTLFKLLLKWRGSIWKAVAIELSIWLSLYYLIFIIYRAALSENRQRTFEKVVHYFDDRLDYIPMNFMLGFFVTNIVNRWTTLYRIIGFIDNIGLMTAEYVRGTNETARLYRRSILRYSQLAQVLVFRDLSMKSRKRFPTLDTVVAAGSASSVFLTFAGFMMPHEKERFDEIQYRYSKYWLPFQWALALTYDARKKGLIESDYYQVVLSEEIKKFRTDLAWLCNYDWVPFPIMYPQLVCLAVHTYFLITVIARQLVIKDHEGKEGDIDLYFPVMSVLQFVFYMGWMKVAEAMLNPFGDDDDDFECNALIDRNFTMGLMIVDRGYNRPPELKRDKFWDEEVELLYSEETADEIISDMSGSASQVKLPENVHEVKMMPHKPDRADPNAIDPAKFEKLVSVVPVNRSERSGSRASLRSLDIVKSVKHKIERSMSRNKLSADLGSVRKVMSHGTIENMKLGDSLVKKQTSVDNEKLTGVYDQHVSLEDEEDPQSPNKKVTFFHHLLDNVPEAEEDDDRSRKRSVFALPEELLQTPTEEETETITTDLSSQGSADDENLEKQHKE